jgi:hypothetical protein
MKLTVFQAGKGDCLLLQDGGTNVLVDGGMRDAYRTHVAPSLGALRDAGEELDLVYVSHIDRDHISGVLQLLDDEIDWRVFDFQRSTGNTHIREPTRPRPPVVRQLWHNGFGEQVKANAGEIEELLAARATVLEASDRPSLHKRAPFHRELATSISEGIELSRRASPEQLGIPSTNRSTAGSHSSATTHNPSPSDRSRSRSSALSARTSRRCETTGRNGCATTSRHTSACDGGCVGIRNGSQAANSTCSTSRSDSPPKNLATARA